MLKKKKQAPILRVFSPVNEILRRSSSFWNLWCLVRCRLTMWVCTVEKLRSSHFHSCMHGHKTCMNLITLQTYYPPICENGLKMANGFKHWKGESRRKVENKIKTLACVWTEALMWLRKSPFLEIPGVEGVGRERKGATSRGLDGKSNGKRRWSGRCAVELQRHFRVDHTKE